MFIRTFLGFMKKSTIVILHYETTDYDYEQFDYEQLRETNFTLFVKTTPWLDFLSYLEQCNVGRKC